MRIWTIQNEAAWVFLQEGGCLLAKPHHQSDNWPEAYDWMRHQMIARIGPPPSPDAAPLWGWYHWLGEARKRPDLRAVRHYWNPPGRYVLLECELPDESVVLSDFDAWHIILNDSYLGVSDEEEEAYRATRAQYETQPSEELAEQLRHSFYKSWERVIDLEALTEPDWHAMEKKSIQACFWKLDLDQVKSIKLFTSEDRHKSQRAHSN
ncbi:MAG: DUF3841 domain-containing protein [Pseudolabrys sp.]